MGTIRLFHPEYAGLVYGPDNDSAIKFGARAGQPDHVAVVDENDPLLQPLLAAHPEITVLHEKGPAEVYPDPYGDHEPFITKQGWLLHMAEAHGIGEAPAPAGATESPAAAEAAPTPTPKPSVRSRARSRSRGRSRPAAKPSPAAATDASPADPE